MLVCPAILFWTLLLEYLADVIASVCLAIVCCLADVIAIHHFVVDVI